MFIRDVRPGAPRLLRFGVFEVDPGAGELRRSGIRVGLQPQPFRLLLRLLDKPGGIVTREELRRELWPEDTFVDFEHSVNVAIARVRQALKDDAERPRFVETLPRRGYRFVAPVEPIADATTAPRRVGAWLWAALAFAIAALATLALMSVRRPAALNAQDTLVVADFVNTAGDAAFNGALRLGLSVQLEQSPFLSVVSRDRIAGTLRQMTRSPDDEIVGSVAREVCQRAGAKVVVNGSITRLGAHYVIGLEALNCRSGAAVANEQAEVAQREQVLQALGSSASRLRRRLGESVATIAQFDVPLEQATTPSLDALKAFSLGLDIFNREGRAAEAAAFLTRAIELDKNFAMAYARLSAVSASLGRFDDEIKYAQEAYARRDRVSERERFYIDSRHCVEPTRGLGNTYNNACFMTVHNLWKKTYPLDWLPYSNLAGAYSSRGQYDEALENGLEAIRLNPDAGIAYLNVVDSYIALDRYADAKRLVDAADKRNVFSDWLHLYRFNLAFAVGDEPAMTRERLAVSGGPAEGELVSSVVEVARFRGRLKEAGSLRDRLERLSRSRMNMILSARSSMWDAAAGLPAHMPDASRPVPSIARYTFAAAAALSGDVLRARQLLGDDELPPESARLVTACRALIGSETGDRSAIEALAADTSGQVGEFLGFNPGYLRGIAYLRLGDAVHATEEFRRIIEHRGIDLTSPLYPLAYVQRARAHVMRGDFVDARRDYEAFFRLWAGADADIPILGEAKREFSKLDAVSKARVRGINDVL